MEDNPQALDKCKTCGVDFIPKYWQLKSHSHECLPCKRIRQNNYNRNDPLFQEKAKRNYQSRRQWYIDYYKIKKLDAVAQWKKKARRKLQTEIESGRIIRPEYCDVCHKRGRIEAHHLNYKEPLNVEWKCSRCHNKSHHGERCNA